MPEPVYDDAAVRKLLSDAEEELTRNGLPDSYERLLESRCLWFSQACVTWVQRCKKAEKAKALWMTIGATAAAMLVITWGAFLYSFLNL